VPLVHTSPDALKKGGLGCSSSRPQIDGAHHAGILDASQRCEHRLGERDGKWESCWYYRSPPADFNGGIPDGMSRGKRVDVVIDSGRVGPRSDP